MKSALARNELEKKVKNSVDNKYISGIMINDIAGLITTRNNKYEIKQIIRVLDYNKIIIGNW